MDKFRYRSLIYLVCLAYLGVCEEATEVLANSATCFQVRGPIRECSAIADLPPSTNQLINISDISNTDIDRQLEEQSVTPETILLNFGIDSSLHLSSEIESLDYIQENQGKHLTIEQIQQLASILAEKISELYYNRRFITSRAEFNKLDVYSDLHNIQSSSFILTIGQTGEDTVKVIEDSILPAQIRIENADSTVSRTAVENFVRNRLSLVLKDNTPVNFNQLEDQLRLLREDPLFDNVSASLAFSPPEHGEHRLTVTAIEANPFTARLSVNNHVPVSIGSEQATLSLSHRSTLTFGDRLSSSYSRSQTGGLNTFDVAYQVPLNALNGTLSLGFESNRTKVTQSPFDSLGIRGNSQRYNLNFRQPVIRTPREELAFSLGVSHTTGQTFIFNDFASPFGIGPSDDGRSRTSVIRFGQSYLSRDPYGAWWFNSQLNLGIGLEATLNQDPIPDGRFFSWLGQAQRSQKLGENHLLIVQADLQLTPDSLLPSEQFVIGGAGSVRGYRSNIRSGDNGFRLSVEDRITVERDSAGRPKIYLIPFLDMGSVWQGGDNPNPLPEDNFLLATGVGLLWENAFDLTGATLRVDYGLPLVDLSDQGNTLQDSSFFFSLDYEI